MKVSDRNKRFKRARVDELLNCICNYNCNTISVMHRFAEGVVLCEVEVVDAATTAIAA